MKPAQEISIWKALPLGFPPLTRARIFALCVLPTVTLFPESAMSQFVDRSKAHLLQLAPDTSHPWAGLWMTETAHVRHELLPDGRYIEARGTRERAYMGRYEVRGTYIYYWDDTGFTADGTFIDGVLYHGGMVLRRSDTGK